MSDIVFSKPALRSRSRAALAALLPDARAAASLAIVHRLSTLGVDSREGAVLVFAPMPSEPDITPLIRRRLAARLPTALPCVDWQTSEMVPRLVADWDRDLVSAGRGVMHPRGSCAILPAPDPIEVAIIPGLAFDLAGNRLGRGGGHYDRFLARLPPHTLTMGVAFDAQIVDNPLPIETHDRPVHIVVTESRTIFGSRGANAEH